VVAKPRVESSCERANCTAQQLLRWETNTCLSDTQQTHNMRAHAHTRTHRCKHTTPQHSRKPHMHTHTHTYTHPDTPHHNTHTQRETHFHNIMSKTTCQANVRIAPCPDCSGAAQACVTEMERMFLFCIHVVARVHTPQTTQSTRRPNTRHICPQAMQLMRAHSTIASPLHRNTQNKPCC
jgi:hypothetical protein